MKSNLTVNFRQAGLWAQYGLTPDYQERLSLVHRLVPDDAESLLDVGCGKGEIINSLAQARPSMRVEGCDLSGEALHYVKTPARQAGLPALPYPDRAFDTVLCLQVLEHIPASDYAAAVDELQRIAGRLLIIGVPYRENLLSKQVLCAACGRCSHADGHLRRYERSDLEHLFPHFRLEQIELAGVRQRRAPRWVTQLTQGLGGAYYHSEHFVCPSCGGRKGRDRLRPRWLRRLSVLAGRGVTRFSAISPYWILGVFRRAA